MDRHAYREGAARTSHLLQPEFVTADAEDRDCVASGVDRDRYSSRPVERERALGGQMVHNRASQLPADPAGLVGACLRQRAGRRTVIGDYRVPGGVVSLYEHCTVTPAAEPEMPVARVRSGS